MSNYYFNTMINNQKMTRYYILLYDIIFPIMKTELKCLTK